MSNRQPLLVQNPDCAFVSGSDLVPVALASRILSVVAARVIEEQRKPDSRSMHPDAPVDPDYRASVVDELLEVVAKVNAVDRAVFLDHVSAFGITAEEVIDVYIPEAARRLGEEWSDNLRSFSEVSIATARLQSMVRELTTDCRADGAAGAHAPSILLVVRQGDDHTLGAMVATCQFRRLGVSVRVMLGQPDRDVLTLTQSRAFDMIALSLSHEDRIEPARKLIKALKSQPGHTAPIVLGGPLHAIRGDLKSVTGADHICKDAADALRLCGLTVALSDVSNRKVQV